MKHILKYCAVLCAGLVILILTGCQNPVHLFQPQSGTGLIITINSDTGGRTLSPSSLPEFSRYVLELKQDSNPNTKRYSAGGRESSITITDLTSGEWTVNVTGWMAITGTEYEIAEGTETVTVTDGRFANVTINIRSTPVQEDGPPGFFSFNVEYPASVEDAELFIYRIGEVYSNSMYNWDSKEFPQSSIYWYIPSGYYMMTFLMNVYSNGSRYRTAAWTEVIHIVPGRLTQAERIFTEDDLTRFITISGPVDVKVDNNPVDFTHIDVYRNASRTMLLGTFEVSRNNPFWRLSLPAFYTPTDLYVSIRASYNDTPFSTVLSETISVNDTDVTHEISYSFVPSIITGTADVKINGSPVLEVWVVVYDDLGNEIGETSVGNDGNWQIRLDSQHNGKTVHFFVRAIDRILGYNFEYDTGKSITLSGANNPVSIDVDISTIKLSGTADITVNGFRPDYAAIEVYHGSTWVSANRVDPANNYSWEVSLPSSLLGEILSIRIEGNDAAGKWYSWEHTSYELLLDNPHMVLSGAFVNN